MTEILRRVLLVVGVYGALFALLYARPGVVEVSIEDFAERQSRRPRWSGDRDVPLAEFVAEQTKDRSVEGTRPGWTALADSLDGGRRFVLPDEAVFSDIAPPLSYDRPFVYARVESGGAVRWLALTWRRGSDADAAPASLTRPLRPWWPFLLGGAILLYGVLPRRRRGTETLAYSTARAAVLPDVVALLLGGLFFTLAVAIPRAFTHDGRLLQPDAWPVYAVAALFVVPAWVIHAFAASYSAFRLDLHPAGFSLRRLFSSREVAYADVARARLEPVRAPKALRRAMWIAALFDVRALSQALLLSSREDARLVLEEKSGRTTRLLLSSLLGADRLLSSLSSAGVRVEDAAAPR